MIYLIGTGPMAQAYAQVLQNLHQEFTVIGRGEQSAAEFATKTQIKPFVGGVDAFIDENGFSENDSVIIATGTETLLPILKTVLNAGVGKVLIEKPAALSIDELLTNQAALEPHKNRVFVAYNRRFYASVAEALRLIEEDGGLESMHFEFTEWAHRIEPLEKAPGVKENWFFANSTHVVDLAFFLAGKPLEWSAFSKKGQLSWHKTSKFVGSGITNRGVLFSYNSHWESAGRWSVELLTAQRRIFLKPLESIEIQMKGSVAIQKHAFNDQMDLEFKPGIYKQVEAFLNQTSLLKSLGEQMDDLAIYQKILG